MPKYFSLSFKQRMVERMTGPNAISANRLAREIGVSQDSLSRWVREASSLADMAKKGARGPRQWTLDEKIRILAAARELGGAELTAFLEREQLLAAELEQWRRALETEAVVPAATAKQIRALERELARKDKALAEAAAILVLKKKLQGLGFNSEDDDEDGGNET
jgi:transposase